MEYLLVMAEKYNVEPENLLNSISKAWKSDKAKCGPLTILSRMKEKSETSFLFTVDSEVAAQIKISKRFLKNLDGARIYLRSLINNGHPKGRWGRGRPEMEF